ncbi:V-set and immunoglobulin domain-containing protein 10-like isoform X2 [Phyllopteryx taeniolatus]|uniref:V-set and immunoglobulin domain-containing protein 10-like isoform X2 n=1 Tax=Phyllopteryx taeniolatus TaxID=161469 RepID=UPI002AD38221|nr:V-set and immunoglobulin domain-containing protein 10-like isoform X2 [Phyllopteryx taeniolatus]
MKRHEGLIGQILIIILDFVFPGSHGELLVSAVSAMRFDTLAGANLTLTVFFSGAPDPAVTWFKGRLPVVTWTIGSDAPPDVAEEYREVLKLEPNGSLSFVHAPLGYGGDYTVEMTKSGLGTASINFTLRVFDGPDEPRIQINPVQDFYVAEDSLTLSCQAGGSPQPLVKWTFGGETLADSHAGVLNLTRVQTSQGGLYTCELRNQKTGVQRHQSVALRVYERPPGSPHCSVISEDNLSLQYGCQWSGGTPPARLSFPNVSEGNGLENFTLTMNASVELDGKMVTCDAEHPIEHNKCNVTAKSPQNFLPAVRTHVDSEGKIVVSIRCLSRAAPSAVVSWFRGGEPVGDGNLISVDTTRLDIRHRNVSMLLLQNYTCTCRNPLGGRSKDVQLQGPSISNFSLFPHKDGTIVTLTWEVPPTSIVTGFDIQMSGPALVSADGNVSQSKGSTDAFCTILPKPGSARSADVFHLDPKSTYHFRVLPRALMAEGRPTKAHRIGPGEGLSGPAIAGIAAGIPCSLLFLLLVCGLVYLCLYWSRVKRRGTRYPVSRAADKVTTTQTQAPHNLLPGGPKSPPDYNRLRQAPSILSVAPPSFVPPPPVRVATTV